jgi:hypothetical protein
MDQSLLKCASALACASILLTACGGGSGSSASGGPSGTPTPAATAGLWKGTVTSSTTGQSTLVVAMTDAAGHSVWMTTDGRIYDGSMPTSGTSFQWPMTGYMDAAGHFPDGTNFGMGTMTVDEQTATMMSGHYSGNGQSGSFTMNMSPMWQRDATLAAVSGTYTRSTSTGYSMTMNIDANGQLMGSDTSGCMLNGSVTAPDPHHDLYQMDGTVTSCGILDGNYHGMAALLDADAMHDWMSTMPGYQHGGMMGGSGMMGGNTVPSGQRNLLMFALVNGQHALMDALAK